MTDARRIPHDEMDLMAEAFRRIRDLELKVVNISGGSWTPFTPTLTATTTNPTMGTNPIHQGAYIRIPGGLVIYRYRIQFGSSGVAAGSGEYRVSVPVNIATPATDAYAMGSAVLFDWSVAGHKELAVAARAGPTAIKMFVKDATVFHNNPFTWANDDRFGGTVIYEAA